MQQTEINFFLQLRLANFRLLLALLFTFFAVAHAKAQTESPEYTYKDFYENLAPYGQWIEDANLGYVWSPDVEGGFRPYFTNGHWAVTQYGNTWISDYIWGWACFHYGRWTFDAYYGWLWIPGADWGAAWVMWRSGPGYMGWAPLSPDYQFKPNLVADPYFPPKDWWVFLPPQYLYNGNFYSFWSGPTGNSSNLKHSSQINNYFSNNDIAYVFGPTVKQIEKLTKTSIVVYSLGTSGNLSTKIHHEDINMFRPAEIRKLSVFGNNPVPPALIQAPQPVVSKPQAINSQLGKTISPFRELLAHTPAAVGSTPVNPRYEHSRTAPQAPDPVPYDWKNNESNEKQSAVEYRVAPVMHPDHGPVQTADPVRPAKDTIKIPKQPVQQSDPIRQEEKGSRK